METLASTPAIADNTAQADTDNADAKSVEVTGDGSAPSVLEADTPAPKDKVQERFDKLTREKYDALREADLARYQVEQFKAQLAEMDKRENDEVAPQTGFPTLEQFGYDEGKFTAAVAQHLSKIAETQGKTAAEATLKTERERLANEQTAKSWATKEAEFIKSKPDYVEKVRQAHGLPISAEMQRELMASDLGPQVAYYLVENREKALAIMALPFTAQLREIGRIEAKLEAAKAPPKPAVSQAPPPVAKVDSSDAEVERPPEEMTQKQFNKWREKHSGRR